MPVKSSIKKPNKLYQRFGILRLKYYNSTCQPLKWMQCERGYSEYTHQDGSQANVFQCELYLQSSAVTKISITPM